MFFLFLFVAGSSGEENGFVFKRATYKPVENLMANMTAKNTNVFLGCNGSSCCGWWRCVDARCGFELR